MAGATLSPRGKAPDYKLAEPATDKVPRADKTADMPEGSREKGAGLEGMNASGGQSQGIKHGDGVGQGGRARKN
ncbi:hypothetical protein UVI_02056950 [Ustilaginoidea virens]|uniref:Uncharacterized protein n=1 Tax=Ustilaginoidea virens TaxID=1159556 RepID=A0A1B5KWM8_USTVR|nr:hypothetical protein UVI_02056950 [Ustilaginoidea virens]